MEWKEYSLGDISKLKYGKNVSAKLCKGPVPIFSGYRKIGTCNTVNCKKDTVIVIARGVGGCGDVKLTKEDCFLTNLSISVELDKGICNAKWFYYNHLLNNLSFLNSGSAQPQITIDSLSKYLIRIPPIIIQRKIAGILSALDSKIENNNKINANLEAQAQALFKSWFVDFTPFKDQPFVDSELGPIPQGWKVGKLGDIALQSTEKVLTRNDVKVLSPITTGKLVLSEEYFTKQVFSKSIRNYKIVKQGAFAYNPARVNIGSLGMNEFKFDGCVSPVYVVFECLKGYSFFFDLFRKTEFFKQAVISFAIGGVRQTLNYSDFALIDATIPPLNIVQSFNEIYLHLKKKISINEKENQRLAALRDTLLPKLMSGEIKL